MTNKWELINNNLNNGLYRMSILFKPFLYYNSTFLHILDANFHNLLFPQIIV